MATPAENDARLQELYKLKAELFARLLSMADGPGEIVRTELTAAVRALQSADDEINGLTEEMFYTLLTDLRP